MMRAKTSSTPFNYGPSLAGGAGAFGNAWGGYWNQRAQQTGSQQDLATAQRIQQQTAAAQQTQAAADRQQAAQQRAAGQGPNWWNAAGAGYAGTPMGDVARRPAAQPAAPQMPAAPAQQQPAAQPPLLAALQQPQQQPALQQPAQPPPEVNAIAKALGQSAGQWGGQNGDQFLKRLRQMLTAGSI